MAKSKKKGKNKTRFFHVLNYDKTWFFDHSERGPGRGYLCYKSI